MSPKQEKGQEECILMLSYASKITKKAPFNSDVSDHLIYPSNMAHDHFRYRRKYISDSLLVEDTEEINVQNLNKKDVIIGLLRKPEINKSEDSSNNEGSVQEINSRTELTYILLRKVKILDIQKYGSFYFIKYSTGNLYEYPKEKSVKEISDNLVIDKDDLGKLFIPCKIPSKLYKFTNDLIYPGKAAKIWANNIDKFSEIKEFNDLVYTRLIYLKKVGKESQEEILKPKSFDDFRYYKGFKLEPEESYKIDFLCVASPTQKVIDKKCELITDSEYIHPIKSFDKIRGNYGQYSIYFSTRKCMKKRNGVLKINPTNSDQDVYIPDVILPYSLKPSFKYKFKHLWLYVSVLIIAYILTISGSLINCDLSNQICLNLRLVLIITGQILQTIVFVFAKLKE